MPRLLSFDQNPDKISSLALSLSDVPPQRIREIVQEDPEGTIRYFARLPARDFQVSHWYFYEGLTQEQIAMLLDVNQSSISKLLKSIIARLQCYSKQEHPTRVGQELEEIFPQDILEPAFFFYFEIQQDRVKDLLRTSQPTAANMFKRILAYLEKAAAEQDPATKTSDKPGLNGHSSLNEENERKNRLVQKYLEYFRFIKDRGHIMTHVVKAHDAERKGSRVKGPSVL